MAGIEFCHDRADEPPDKEEYEKKMGYPLTPDPGEFAGMHIKTIQGFTSLRSGGAIITTNMTIIAWEPKA